MPMSKVQISIIDARFILGVLGCLQRQDGIPSSPTFDRLRKAILEAHPDADVSWTCWQMRSLLEDARTFRRHRAAIIKSHT